MAIKMGTENKRQVYLAIGLFVVIIPLAIWQLGFFSSSKPNTAAKPAGNATQTKAGTTTAQSPTKGQATQTGPAAEKVTTLNIDPALHLEKLSYTESILYEGRGRNIFSADSVPMGPIETPLTSARPDTATLAPGGYTVTHVEKPSVPPIDLKYFGYMLGKNKTFSAFFVRGDDIFTAHTGEIVDHRYMVGTISATSVQVTDLSWNDTQDVKLTAGSVAGGNRE